MKEIIHRYNQEVFKTYDQYNLRGLRGHDNDYIVNNRQILAWYFEVTRKGKIEFRVDFNFNENFDDLTFCSDEIIYFLANMYLHKPYMNNPLNEAFELGENMIYPNFQNLEAKRYSMFANVVSEKLYNFWDRIGDLIAAYFPGLLKPNRIYFPTVIDAIPDQFSSNCNYLWLKEFRENGYVELNNKRKKHVHYTTEDTEFKNKHLNNPTDRSFIESLLGERDKLTDFYHEHHLLTLQGFEKTLLFIEDITGETLTHIPDITPPVPNTR